MRLPRVAKAQPRAGIGERFQRYLFPIFLRAVMDSTFCASPLTTLTSAKLCRSWFGLDPSQHFAPLELDFVNSQEL